MIRLGKFLFFLAVINFGLFIIGAFILGGDAMNGKVENGHYYVANHGKLTEVSRMAWTYSYMHVISVWITHPLAMLGGVLMVVAYQRKRRSNRS